MWEGLSNRLEGPLVVLEPLSAEHEEALFEASRDPEVWRWLLGFVPTREQLAGWLTQSVADTQEGRAAAFATVWRRTNTPVGARGS